MSRTDDMRWRDWGLRTPRRCRCGAEFMPDVPQQDRCRPCAHLTAEAERAPVTADQAHRERHEHRERMDAAGPAFRPVPARTSDGRSRGGSAERQRSDRAAQQRTPDPIDTNHPDRLDGIVVTREVEALNALSTTEWRDFPTIAGICMMRGRALGPALRRLQQKGKVQKRGHDGNEEWRRQPGKKARCEACDRPFE